MSVTDPEPIRVLHVDDDPDFTELVAIYLERERDNFEVVTATSATEGIDRLAEAEIVVDCVVSDYDMPGMNGLEFLEAVRESHPDLPFILFTGRGGEEIASEAITAGISEYLNKKSGTDQYTVLANRIDNLVAQYRTERELQASTERLRKLYGGITDAIFVLDADWRFTHLNDRAEEILEQTEAELVGENVWDQFPKAVDTPFQDEYEKAMNQRVPVEFETFYPPLDVWVEVRAVPTEDGLTAHFRDISEKKERERQIQRQNERLRTIVENAPIVLFTLDEDGVFTLSEGRGLAELGLEAGEFVGESAFDVYADTPIVDDVRRAIDGEAVHSITAIGERVFEAWYQPVENGGYTGERVTGVAIDITEQKQYQRELERSEELLDKTQRMATVGGWELDLSDDELRWTDEINRIYGFPTDYEPGLQEAIDPFLPEDRALLEDAMERAIAAGESYDLELRLRTAAGELRWVRALGEPHRERGETVTLQGTLQDITERKEREQELRSTSNTLSTLLSSIPAGVLAEDGSREILFANRSLCELFSIPGDPDDLVGTNCAAAAADLKGLFADPERFVEGNNTYVAEGRTVSREELELTDGRTIERSGTPIDVAEGEDRYLWLYHDITERKRVEETLRALHDGTREMMEATDRQAVCAIAAETSKRVLGHTITVVRLLDDEETLVPVARTEETREQIGERPAYPIGETPAGRAYREGTARIYDDLAELDATTLAEGYDRGNARAAMYLPVGEHGVISVADTAAGRFDRSDLQLAKVLAANTKTALDRVDHERTLEMLHEGTRAMMSAETPMEVSEVAVETARNAISLPLTGCWLYDPDDVCLRPTAFTNAAHALFDEFPTYTAGNSLSWEVFTTGEPAVYDDVSSRSDVYNPDTPIGSEIVVPIGDYGILTSGSTEPGQFDNLDISAARILAANAETALERAERERLLRDREAQLERERDRFAKLFENIPDPSVIVEILEDDAITQSVNAAFEDVFGYASERAVGQSLNDLIVPPDRMGEARDIDRNAVDGDDIMREVRRRTADGEVRDFLFRNVSIDQEGEYEAFGIYTDITERREAEEYRRRLYEIVADAEMTAAERVAKLLDLGRERLGVETGFLTHIEDGTQRIVEACGSHEKIQPGSECPLSQAYCRRTIEADGPLTLWHASKAGWAEDPAYEEFGLEAYVGSKLTVGGDLYGTVCFADRTPHEMDFSAVELSFVDLVTRGIASEVERRRYERELERQNDRLEEFAIVVSHDLRNPLGVAQGYLELARESGENDDFAKITRAHDRIESIIEDVLTLARQGRTVGDPQPVSLAAIAEQAWSNVETDTAQLLSGDDLGTIDADEGRLEQVFENLFRNAIEHGGDDVTVHIDRSATGFYVEDDGPGIPDTEREQVFDHGHTTSESGTGFGLSIVEQIAEAHGWKITAGDGTDGGARFEIHVATAPASR